MKKQRFKLIIIVLLLLISIWVAWPESSPSEASHAASNDQSRSNNKGIGWHLLGFKDDGKSNRSGNRPNSSEESEMKRIDRLITNQTLSNKEVAEKLLVIAKDKRMSEHIRAEALGHGVILDLTVFVGMCADAQLPEAMAQNLLQHVINENRDPSLQIHAYKDFLNHSSSEIREQARQVLAFILEDDEGKADEAALLQMADAKLEQIAAEKPLE
jgi:hypothetical protein